MYQLRSRLPEGGRLFAREERPAAEKTPWEKGRDPRRESDVCREDALSAQEGGEAMTEHEWDRFLRIRTSGRDDSRADTVHYPYEATPYPVLERLAGCGLLDKHDIVADYGCGKGRVAFFLAWQLGCRTIGVERDERLLQTALENRKTARGGARTEFLSANAESFTPEGVTAAFFFNPFSEQILRSVLARIRESLLTHPRQMRLIFYYPSNEYAAALLETPWLELEEEISVKDLFGSDPREELLIFRSTET